VVNEVRKTGHLALIVPYLKQVQQHNIAVVNEALNECYVEGEQYEDLRQSIEDYEEFDQIALAQKLEKHELTEMRRIAALVYKKNKRFKQSIELSKQDKVYKDAMDTARDSGNQDLAEALVRYFDEAKLPDCFCACLYTCYDLIRPDVALELAWRSRNMDMAMPFLIQTLREYTGRVDALDKKTLQKEEAEEKQKSAPNDYVPDYMMPAMSPMGGMPGMGGPLAIMGPTPMQQPMPFGAGPQALQPGMGGMMPQMGGY